MWTDRRARPSANPKAGPAPTVGFVTLGCPKNQVDTQVMADRLLAAGFRPSLDPESADIVLVNTCAFIEPARAESRRAIRALCRSKRLGHCRGLIVAGCFAQRDGAAILREWPEVDAVLGVDQIHRVADVARRVARGERDLHRVSARPSRLFEPRRPGVVLSGGAYAYLKISEGCNHRCAFCAIPAIRGRHRSRPAAAVLAEAGGLLDRGFRELDVIGQDICRYGSDRGERHGLARLLRALDRLPGDFWIRLLYAYPSGISRELLAVTAGSPHMCRYFDVPVQHSHPDILRAMGRADTLRALDRFPDAIRESMPDAALRTTCLVGFPGETRAHFNHLLRYVQRMEFDHLGAFVFSPETGTPAEALPDRPAPDTARKRRDELMLAQREIVRRKALTRAGRETRVLLDRPLPAAGGRTWRARSEREAPDVDGVVRVRQCPATARVGDFLTARFLKPAGYDMLAVAVPPTGDANPGKEPS